MFLTMGQVHSPPNECPHLTEAPINFGYLTLVTPLDFLCQEVYIYNYRLALFDIEC